MKKLLWLIACVLLIGFLSTTNVSAVDCNVVYGFVPSCASMPEEDCENSVYNDSGTYYQCDWNVDVCQNGAECDAEPYLSSSSSSSVESMGSTSSSEYSSSSSSSSSTSSTTTPTTTTLACSGIFIDDCTGLGAEECTDYYSVALYYANCEWHYANGEPEGCYIGEDECSPINSNTNINSTLDMVVGLLPKFGDLLTGVGTNIIWPVVYILIILGVAAIVLGLFGMITGIAFAVIAVVQKFSHGMGGRHGK